MRFRNSGSPSQPDASSSGNYVSFRFIIQFKWKKLDLFCESLDFLGFKIRVCLGGIYSSICTLMNLEIKKSVFVAILGNLNWLFLELINSCSWSLFCWFCCWNLIHQLYFSMTFFIFLFGIDIENIVFLLLILDRSMNSIFDFCVRNSKCNLKYN